MKSFVRGSLVFLIACFFSVSASAGTARFKMEGKGDTVQAVKAFNRAVVSSGGTVDGNAQTEFSAVGKFPDGFVAKMSAEDAGKGLVRLNVAVSRESLEVIGLIFGIEKQTLMEIATKVGTKLDEAGYVVYK